MTTHLQFDGATRAETDGAVIANLVRKGWQVFTPEPEPVAAPTYTAEQWIDAQGYGGARSTTCLYLRLQLQAAGKDSPKLAASQAWLDSIIAAAAMNPDAQHADLPAAPFPFAEVAQEALAQLQQKPSNE